MVCNKCLKVFPGVRNIMIKIRSLEDKYKNLKNELIRKAAHNSRKCIRKCFESLILKLVCFYMPESESTDPTERKTDDESNLKSLIDDDMKLRDKGIENKRVGRKTPRN